MKARDAALKLKNFELNEKARKIADLEQMIREFETIGGDLDRQIQAEEERSGVKDPAHFAYSTFAKSAAQRRENIKSSIDELLGRLEVAQKEYEEAEQQVSRLTSESQAGSGAETPRRRFRNSGLALR